MFATDLATPARPRGRHYSLARARDPVAPRPLTAAAGPWRHPVLAWHSNRCVPCVSVVRPSGVYLLGRPGWREPLCLTPSTLKHSRTLLHLLTSELARLTRPLLLTGRLLRPQSGGLASRSSKRRSRHHRLEVFRRRRATAEDRRYCANLTYPNADGHISLSDSRSVAVERLAQLVGSGLGRRVRIALVAGIRGAAQAVHPPAPNLDGHPPPPVSPKRHC